MALASPSGDAELAVEAVPGGSCAPQALAFMPRLFVLTTLPHRRPQGHRFEHISGCHSLRMEAPRRIGLPYGVYPRLLLGFLATEAVRKKSREIHLGATPDDLARKLGLWVISGPRGTAQRLQAQVRKLTSTTWSWQSTEPSSHSAPTHRTATTVARSLQALAVSLGLFVASWRSRVLLHEHFSAEITHSAVPVDLRAVHRTRATPPYQRAGRASLKPALSRTFRPVQVGRVQTGSGEAVCADASYWRNIHWLIALFACSGPQSFFDPAVTAQPYRRRWSCHPLGPDLQHTHGLR